MIAPPQSIAELMQRAEALAGLNLLQISEKLKTQLPQNLLHDKGTIGQLLENILGATAKSNPTPDFPELGVELKTLPIKNSKPAESTFVCVVNYNSILKEEWKSSLVKLKLSKVLWFPIPGAKNIPIKQRSLGTPLLWQPTPQQEKILQQDWEELVELIQLGRLEEISATFGEYLQIRPKAANAKSLTSAIGNDGNVINTLPRGFYLRAKFTEQILREHFI